jgi:scyllo-inositol 2-dehydrogenase (NADP+)
VPAPTAWVTPAPWPGVDSGGHGRIVMEFDDVLFQTETSRVCRLDRPRWWVVGTDGGYVSTGSIPRRKPYATATWIGPRSPGEPRPAPHGERRRGRRDPRRDGSGSWDSYYANIADY